MKLFVATKAVVVHENKILLLRESVRYVDGTETGNYDFPGGRIDPFETLSQALEREVAEEAGLQVVQGELFHVYENFPIIKGEECHIVRLYFACRALTHEVTLSSDHDHFLWINPAEHAHYSLIENEHETLERYLAIRKSLP